MTHTPLLQKRSFHKQAEASPGSGTDRQMRQRDVSQVTKKARAMTHQKNAMPAPRSLKEALKALNQRIHDTLASGVRPEKEAVESLVSQIQRLAKNEASSQEEVAVIVAEKDHLCEMGLRSSILTLNAIQSLLWNIETRGHKGR